MTRKPSFTNPLNLPRPYRRYRPRHDPPTDWAVVFAYAFVAAVIIAVVAWILNSAMAAGRGLDALVNALIGQVGR